MKEDLVNHPKHYQLAEGKEVIDFLTVISTSLPSEIAYSVTNAMKYISRAPRKGAPIQDLRKAIFYIEHAIKLTKNDGLDDLDVYRTVSAMTKQTGEDVTTFFEAVAETYPSPTRGFVILIGLELLEWWENDRYIDYPEDTTIHFLQSIHYDIMQLIAIGHYE